MASNAVRLAGAALVVGGAVTLTPIVATAALGVAGFGSGGVVAGSAATVAQSYIYGGLTTGAFSMLQSAGATAAAPAIGTMLAGAAATVGGGFMMRR